MEIAFDSQKIRSICEDQSVATKELGSDIAEALKRRLADVRAANTVPELPTGNPRIVHHSQERLTMDLGGGYVISLEANHRRNPIREGDEIDWTRVSRLRVVSIGRADE